MIYHTIVAGALLAIAVAIALVAASGLAVLTDAYERLHLSSIVVSLSAGLTAAAVWLEDGDWQARIKVSIVAFLLFAMNSILNHATARAKRISQTGHWTPEAEEQIPIAGRTAAGSMLNRLGKPDR
jgi:monovalent cation/proton antiporter MnhG/PhaG subunit